MVLNETLTSHTYAQIYTRHPNVHIGALVHTRTVTHASAQIRAPMLPLFRFFIDTIRFLAKVVW